MRIIRNTEIETQLTPFTCHLQYSHDVGWLLRMCFLYSSTIAPESGDDECAPHVCDCERGQTAFDMFFYFLCLCLCKRKAWIWLFLYITVFIYEFLFCNIINPMVGVSEICFLWNFRWTRMALTWAYFVSRCWFNQSFTLFICRWKGERPHKKNTTPTRHFFLWQRRRRSANI